MKFLDISTAFGLLSAALVGCGGSAHQLGESAGGEGGSGNSGGEMAMAGSGEGGASGRAGAGNNAAGADPGGTGGLGGSSGDTSPGGTGSGGGGALDSDCTQSGGTVVTMLCCKESDFPDMCLSMNTCVCAPSNSHEVKSCACPGGSCFDGHLRRCVPFGG